MNKRAFTLAEVLITLGIIGVVAAMTIPTLVADYQDRSFSTAATTFERKLGEALKIMNSQQTLAGHTSTESFVEELSKHFKIVRTCANDKLMDCFGDTVYWGTGDATPEAVDMTAIKTSKHFGQKTWDETDIVGVQFANGTSALIAYNKNAKQDPFNNDIITITGSSTGKKGSVELGTDAIAILYDTNGFKSPNKSTKDLRSINVTKLGSGCFAEVNGMCLAMAPQVPTPVTKAECEQMITEGYGITACNYDNDYWAGAVKACGGTSKMASSSDLAKIASYIFDTTIGATETTYDEDLVYYSTKATELGLPTPPFYLWSGEEKSNGKAYARAFDDDGTQSYNDGESRNSNYHPHLAVCIE